MKRLLIVVCALVAVALAAAAVPATAQDGERPAGRLWDEFPLEPSVTPTATASATESRPAVVRPVEDDGLSPTALIPLLAAAAGLGALTAYTAGRRRRVVGRQPAAPPDEAARLERALRAPSARGLSRRSAPARRKQSAAPTPESSPDAPAPQPRKRARASKPAPDAADATRAAEAPAKPAPPRKPRTRTSAAKPAPAAEPVADATQATDKPPAEPVEQPAPAREQRTRARAPRPAPDPAAPEPVADAAPAAEPVSQGDGAPRARRPAERPAGPFAEWDTCRIKLQSRSINSHFFAVPFDGGPVIARSPYFKAGRDGQGIGPAEALRALVSELTAAGWHQTGSGRAPWDLRFRRDVEAKRPLTPR